MTLVTTPRPDLAIMRTPVGLDLPPGLTFDEWKEIGLPLLEAGQSLMWWIGDWLNYGRTTYGTTYTAAGEWTGMDYQTLANAKWVAKNIELSLRKENLSFSHHAAVAALPSAQQVELLELAVQEGWTVQGLKGEVRHRNETNQAQDAADAAAHKGESTTPAKKPSGTSTRVEVGLQVRTTMAHAEVVRGAVVRAADGLRSWFGGEQVDAVVEITT